MKNKQLAKLISDAMIAGAKIVSDQWQYCIFSGLQPQMKQGEQQLAIQQEISRQMKIMQEREFVQIQHAEKMNEDEN
jgi:hypothetical protein